MDVLKASAERTRTHGDVINLAAGQPSTGAPRVALDAVGQALNDNVMGYTEAAGEAALREAIAHYHSTTYGYEVTADQIVVTTGSSGAFTALFLAAFDASDTVVMTRPGYPPYRNTLAALGLKVHEIDCGPQSRYQLTGDMLEALPAPPAGVIVASPANPTGTVVEPHVLAEIAQWCDDHDTLLLSDEIYHGLTYDGVENASAWQYSKQAVVMGSFSKYFSMTGWRLGWMLLPKQLHRPVDLIIGNLAICPPAISQLAGQAALSAEAQGELQDHVRRYTANREALLSRLGDIGISRFAPPDGAFYCYADVSHLTTDSLTWCSDVLEATGVAITPGIDFDPAHGHQFVRFSFAGDIADVHEAFDRLGAYCS